MAELACLLSAIADVPLKQSLAVTGSVNQLGEVQAVGAVNEKIEGFFDVCKIGGLTGDQGVIIPRSTVAQLMLKPELVAAVRQGQFHIYAVQTIDEAIELLTDMPSKICDRSGLSKTTSVRDRIQARLLEFFKQICHNKKLMTDLKN